MASVLLYYPLNQRNATIGGIVIDALETERHTLRLEKSNYPIESGATLSDHIIKLPRTLSIKGVVVAELRGQRGQPGVSSEPERRDLNAWRKFEKIYEQRTPVQIVTSLGVYRSMVMLDLNVKRDVLTANALDFEASFEQMQVAASESFVPEDAVALEDTSAVPPGNVRYSSLYYSLNRQTTSAVGPPVPVSSVETVSAGAVVGPPSPTPPVTPPRGIETPTPEITPRYSPYPWPVTGLPAATSTPGNRSAVSDVGNPGFPGRIRVQSWVSGG